MSSAAARAGGSRPRAVEELAQQLYASHRGTLLAMARRNCHDPHDAEEALHDAFVLFIGHFDHRQGSPPLAWLRLTLKRRCWAIYGRSRAGAKAYGRLDRAATERSEERLEHSIEAGRLGRALRDLRPDQRRAIALVALGYSYREICEITGWTYTKVNRCLVEGRAALRAE